MRVQFGRGVFDGFPAAGQLDPFSRALEARRRSVAAGFDNASGWGRYEGIMRHLKSEVREFDETVRRNEPFQRQMDEMGDVLYVATQLAGMQGIDPHRALEEATNKFVKRMGMMESIAQERYGERPVTSLGKNQWRQLWKEAKNRLNVQA